MVMDLEIFCGMLHLEFIILFFNVPQYFLIRDVRSIF